MSMLNLNSQCLMSMLHDCICHISRRLFNQLCVVFPERAYTLVYTEELESSYMAACVQLYD